MRIVIAGAGAMGSLLGGLLMESGAELILYDISARQVAAIQSQGLRIEGDGKLRTVQVPATTRPDELGVADLLIILVKSYDTLAAVQSVRHTIGPQTLVLTLQNGLGNVAAITSLVPADQVLAGVTAHGAMLIAPGLVRHSGGAQTFIGPVVPQESSQTVQSLQAARVAAVLSAAGIVTQLSLDINQEIWQKLVVNVAINPLTALTGLTNGALLEDPGLLSMMAQLVREVEAVAAAEGIALRQENLPYVKSVCQATSSNRSSMLMDISRGNRTEIDAINGMIVSRAAAAGLAATMNQTLVWLVKALEKSRAGQSALEQLF